MRSANHATHATRDFPESAEFDRKYPVSLPHSGFYNPAKMLPVHPHTPFNGPPCSSSEMAIRFALLEYAYHPRIRDFRKSNVHFLPTPAIPCTKATPVTRFSISIACLPIETLVPLPRRQDIWPGAKCGGFSRVGTNPMSSAILLDVCLTGRKPALQSLLDVPATKSHTFWRRK
jgi:hypothetical protein